MNAPVIISNAQLWLCDCREILPTLPKYFDIACRRIDDAQRQDRLIA